MATLGEIQERRLQKAVDLGYIHQTDKEEWVMFPPRTRAEFEHRRFILKLVKEAEEK